MVRSKDVFNLWQRLKHVLACIPTGNLLNSSRFLGSQWIKLPFSQRPFQQGSFVISQIKRGFRVGSAERRREISVRFLRAQSAKKHREIETLQSYHRHLIFPRFFNVFQRPAFRPFCLGVPQRQESVMNFDVWKRRQRKRKFGRCLNALIFLWEFEGFRCARSWNTNQRYFLGRTKKTYSMTTDCGPDNWSETFASAGKFKSFFPATRETSANRKMPAIKKRFIVRNRGNPLDMCRFLLRDNYEVMIDNSDENMQNAECECRKLKVIVSGIYPSTKDEQFQQQMNHAKNHSAWGNK